jgi:CDP-diacylglycerol--serine O-phosphatidyltransferase
MISRLRYRSFREVDLRSRRSFVYVLPMAAVLIAVALDPKTVLLLLFSIYLVSGPVAHVFALLRRGGLPTSQRTPDSSATRVEVVDGSATR